MKFSYHKGDAASILVLLFLTATGFIDALGGICFVVIKKRISPHTAWPPNWEICLIFMYFYFRVLTLPSAGGPPNDAGHLSHR